MVTLSENKSPSINSPDKQVCSAVAPLLVETEEKKDNKRQNVFSFIKLVTNTVQEVLNQSEKYSKLMREKRKGK